MADTSPNALVAAANCYACALGDKDLIKLGLLKDILLALDPMADTSPNALVAAAKCYACAPGFYPLFELGLLLLIANSISGGGASGVTCGTADPVAAPSGTCGLYYRTDNGSLWKWNGAAWEEIIGP